MSDELLELAQETQRRHAALIGEASRRTSTEARAEVRNELDGLRQSFTARALALTQTEAPYLWQPANPDHAVALAVRADIADTEEKLSRLAASAAFQKAIKSDFGYGLKINVPSGPALAIGALGVILIVAAILVVRR